MKDTSVLEKIRKHMWNGNWEEMMDKLCSIKENELYLNYKYFKYCAIQQTYSIILSDITKKLDTLLLSYDNFIVHVDMQNMTISDIDKHSVFIQSMSSYLKEKYPDKLLKCCVYNAPFIFSQIFNLVSIFIDKNTQKKIEIIK